MKNPEFTICNEAVMLFLRDGTSIEKTIRTCQEIRKFVAVRRVKGGAVKNGKYLGKVVRWYIQEGEFGIIEYAKNGNKVPNSDGGCPVMNFEDFPDDIRIILNGNHSSKKVKRRQTKPDLRIEKISLDRQGR